MPHMRSMSWVSRPEDSSCHPHVTYTEKERERERLLGHGWKRTGYGLFYDVSLTHGLEGDAEEDMLGLGQGQVVVK